MFYFLLVFVLVQNFLLAVIVEAFIEVREENLLLQVLFPSQTLASIA